MRHLMLICSLVSCNHIKLSYAKTCSAFVESECRCITVGSSNFLMLRSFIFGNEELVYQLNPKQTKADHLSGNKNDSVNFTWWFLSTHACG